MPRLVEIDPVILEKKILKFRQYIFFCFYFPLLKDLVLYLSKFESPLPKDALYQVWLILAKWFWRRGGSCEKFMKTTMPTTTMMMTDTGHIVSRKAPLSFRVRWAKKHWQLLWCFKTNTIHDFAYNIDREIVIITNGKNIMKTIR